MCFLLFGTMKWWESNFLWPSGGPQFASDYFGIGKGKRKSVHFVGKYKGVFESMLINNETLESLEENIFRRKFLYFLWKVVL